MTGTGPDGTPSRADDAARLGLPPGADARALRSAYARALKTVKPDIDPAGFQAVREAYERLREALDRPEPAAPGSESPGAAPTEAAEPPPGTVDGQACADLIHRFEARRRRGDVAGALAAVDGTLSGTLDMAWRQAVEDGLFDALADDPSARRDLIQALATRFDWREARTRQDARDPERMARLRGRIEAADFVDDLRAREAAARGGLGPPGDRLLLRLLDPYRVGLFDRALDADERAVGVAMIDAVFDHLAEIDDVIDARTIAALRGALGAAPFGKPLPGRVTPGQGNEGVAGEPSSGIPAQVSDAPSWLGGGGGGIWIALALVAAMGGAHRATYREAPSPDWTELHRPVQVTRPPPIEMNFPIMRNGGRLGLNLAPLLAPKVRAQLRGVRIEEAGDMRFLKIDDVAGAPVQWLPRGRHRITVALVFADGVRTQDYAFDLEEHVPPPSGEPPDAANVALNGPDDPPPPPPAERGPGGPIQFAPGLALEDGRILLDLSAALMEENLKVLRALRLRTMPGGPAETLDVAALKAEPRRPLPDSVTQLSLQLLYLNGGESREFPIDLTVPLARLRTLAPETAARAPAPAR